ncbi:hypothetical protein LA5095_06220 [Roseibium album]|uniref:Uncharacterized protein n=1 Tax=Roseibium album TaxID=311410 RepID=A0A0M7B0U4_9HYPH|nr:hypothetical protein LA5094_06190 [Roseibium album]CTQ79454.1 hypothetical protein LA5096_06201 [Roseibium album]CTQ80978.1 hypothetical protein LA5095_06220 [Roseibium album]
MKELWHFRGSTSCLYVSEMIKLRQVLEFKRIIVEKGTN